ncbi:MAG: hypothetical protein WCV62_01880 [Candidatus Peribacteraceae bacterium]
MKPHASRRETFTTAAGTLLLALLAFILWLPAETSLRLLSSIGIASLLRTPFLIPAVLLLTLLLGYSLVESFFRHRDFSPLFFAFFGVSMLLLAILTDLPPLVPLLCGCSILIAGIWSIAAPTTAPFDVTALPGLDEFMDAPAAPQDHEEQ